MTRIVAGASGGRRLAVPPKGTRPTSERVREALFGALTAAFDLAGATVLDLYAGSGALGLEALSRGAGAATFVESDRRAVEVLRRNIAALGVGAAATVRSTTVVAALAGPAPRPFDLVLADPPYALTNAELAGVLNRVTAGGWLAADGILVVERAARDGRPEAPAGLAVSRSRRYGDTVTHWLTAE